MKKKILIGLILLGSGFILLFTYRIIYGFIAFPDSSAQNQMEYIQNSDNSTRTIISKNYASDKRKIEVNEQIINIDQKYEMIAKINSYTDKYEKDESIIRETIKKYKSLIQYEKKSGLKSKRFLYLSIGVPPENYTNMVNEVKKIGILKNFDDNKLDKTNEYKQLNAKLNSLIKTRNALIDLKKRGAKVEELINLEYKILEIEKEIQQLGVDLGNYDEENEFCTIEFSLKEKIFKSKKISPIHRILVAFQWTAKYYFFIILTLFIGFLLILIVIAILDKLKVFKKLIDILDNSSQKKQNNE